jgi:hypothetical protein
MVTPDGIQELRTRLPFADVDSFAKNPQIKNMGNLFTVDMVTKYIEHKLNSAPTAA